MKRVMEYNHQAFFGKKEKLKTNIADVLLWVQARAYFCQQGMSPLKQEHNKGGLLGYQPWALTVGGESGVQK